MARHRPFTDGAGFTRHCWECAHARGWRKGQFSKADIAMCELTHHVVEKFGSPDNQCSHVGVGCEYQRKGAGA